MSYIGVAQAAADNTLRTRVAACIAREQGGYQSVFEVVERIMWQCCAEPGWGEAWDYGMEVRREAASDGIFDLLAIGADPSVIPDSWVLTAVQKHLGLLSEQSGT